MDNEKPPEDSESMAATFRPPPTFSERPTLRMKRNSFIGSKYFFIIAVLLCALSFGAGYLIVSKYKKHTEINAPTVYSIPAIPSATAEPTPVIIVTPSIDPMPIIPEVKTNNPITNPIVRKPIEKDYGI